MKKVIIGMIICLGILLLGGFLWYFLNNTPKKETKHEELDINEFINIYDNSIFPKLNNYDNVLYNKYPITNMNKITDYDKTVILLEELKDTKKDISLNELNKIKNKYFLNVRFYKNNITVDNNTIYKYSKNKYVYGNTPYNTVNVQAVSTSFDELYTDYIKLSQKLIYFKSIQEPDGKIKNTFYKDPLLNNIVYESEGDLDISEELQKKLEEQADTYNYYFEKYGNEYILISVTK